MQFKQYLSFCTFFFFLILQEHTTSRTVEWAVAEFLHNPKVLTTAQNELRELLGNHDGKVDRV